MPGFEDSALIVLLALLLFGPKKLPELARQFGKLMADFRRASSEFRTQMEDELRISEQVERQKKIAAETAATSASSSVATSVATAETSTGDAAQERPSEYADQDLLPVESSLDYTSDSDFDSSLDSLSESELESSSDYPVSDYPVQSELESTSHYAPEDQGPSMPDPTPDFTPETPLESTAHSAVDSTAPPTPQPASPSLSIATIEEVSIRPPATGLPALHTAPEPLSDAVPAHREASETEALHG